MAAGRTGIIPDTKPLALFGLVAAIILLDLGTIGVDFHLHNRRSSIGHAKSGLIAGYGHRQNEDKGQEASVHSFLFIPGPPDITITGPCMPAICTTATARVPKHG